MLKLPLIILVLLFITEGSKASSSHSNFVGTAPLQALPPQGQGWLPVEGEPRHVVRVPDFSKNRVHPRLFFWCGGYS